MSHQGSPSGRPEPEAAHVNHDANNNANPEMTTEDRRDDKPVQQEEEPRVASRGRSGSYRGYDSPREQRDSRAERGDRNERMSHDRGTPRGGSNERPPDSTQVYVAGISRSITSDDLKDGFDKFGPIRDVVMKGKYAFLDYEKTEDANAAIEAMNGKDFKGYNLCVEATRTAPGQNKGRRRAGPTSQDECWKCGKQGHWANECRNGGGDRDRRDGGRRYGGGRRGSRSRSPYRGGGGDRGGDRGGRGRSRSNSYDDGRSKELREGRCFICKEKGHIKRDCPDLRRDGGRGGSRYHDNRNMRRHSRSRSPYRGGGGGRGGRRNYSPSRSPPRRREYSRSPPRRREYSRSPPRRREYSRSRSPPRRYVRGSRSPSYQN